MRMSVCTCLGVVSLASISGGEGKWAEPGEESWHAICSGENASLLSSSNEELSATTFENSVSDAMKENGKMKGTITFDDN